MAEEVAAEGGRAARNREILRGPPKYEGLARPTPPVPLRPVVLSAREAH